MRLFLFSLVLLLNGVLLGAAAGDSTSPTVAAMRFYAAIKSDDPSKIAESIFLRSPDELGEINIFARLLIAQRRLARAASLQFKDEKDSVVEGRITNDQLDENGKLFASASVVEDGDRAEISVALVKGDDPEIMYLRRAGTMWKVDLGRMVASHSLTPIADTADAPLQLDIWLYLTMIDSINRLADDVGSGKFKTFKEVKDAAQQIPRDAAKQEFQLLDKVLGSSNAGAPKVQK